jgi:hypothetical protein
VLGVGYDALDLLIVNRPDLDQEGEFSIGGLKRAGRLIGTK